MTRKAPIRVYSTDGSTLTLQAEINEYESAIFTRSRSECGSFKVVISGELPKAQYFEVGNFVHVPPVASRIGVITKITKSKSGTTNKWTVTGEEAKCFAWRRRIQYTGMGHYTLNSAAETVIKTAFDRFFGASAESNRQVPLFTTPASTGIGGTYLLSERFSFLGDALQKCSEATGVWWRLELDEATAKLVLKVSAGTDRTSGQTLYPPAPFSEKFLTTGAIVYSEDTEDYFNVAIVAGQGEDTARTIRTVGTTTGINRREDFIDARDLSSNADLDSRGASELAAVADTVGVDITAMTKSQLLPDQDYFLADTVSIAAFGVETDKPITSITESFDSSGYGIDLTFGKPVATRYTPVEKLDSRTFRATSV